MNDVISHKCPNCDGPLLFNPEEQSFHCEYCLSVFKEDDIQLKKEESNVEEVTKETFNLYACPSCGAEVVTEETTAATFCYYCHNPVVLKNRVSGEFLPNAILPFKISEKEAKKKFIEWANSKKYIPKDFFDQSQIEKMTGVYFPYWNVNANISGSVKAKGTKIDIWRVGQTEYTRTRRYDLLRKGDISFKSLLKTALSKNVKQNMIDSVQPFPIEECQTFDSKFLSGFQAEKRDLEFQDIKDSVQSELNHYSENLLLEEIVGYGTITQTKSKINLLDQSNEYYLLPLWIVTYKNSSGEEPYYFAMNGVTGNTSGVLPIQKSKLMTHTAGIAALVGSLILLGGYLLF